MAEFMCLGDCICLYCENTGGYVNSDQTSSTRNGLFVYTGQDRDRPVGIPNVHAITFRVSSQNRYKLTKKYRQLVEQHGESLEDPELAHTVSVAKIAAEAELQDNQAEQSRLQGKRIRYGDVIQLRHVFTNKFVHVSTTETSVVDKSKMMVALQTYDSKHALFTILPRYKVKAEGEFIETYDQIILESVKSPGTFLHASDPYRIDHFTFGSELNLGVERAGFTWVKHSRPDEGTEGQVNGGNVVRLFHKDLEAFLTAEGVFGEEPTEQVHLRIREIDPNVPRTLYKPKSGLVYWQVESAASIVAGTVLKWEDSVRFRHMTTRRYLFISNDLGVGLTTDGHDPMTVFRIHALSQKPQSMKIDCGSDCRIEHVVSGCWLHGPIDVAYERQHHQQESASSMDALRWDGATLVKVVGSSSRQYPDAYTIQKVQREEWNHFNYVAGMIPFLKDLTQTRKEGEVFLNARITQSVIATLRNLKDFVMDKDKPLKDRQKLLRNLRLVDVMVDLVNTPLNENLKDFVHLSQVFRSVYGVLHCYTRGSSKKNALYLAHYIPFFNASLLAKGGVGLQCCRMLIDLIRDNRKIVDRITTAQVNQIIVLLREQKHHLYLDLLGVLSVCNGIAMTENQTQIAVNLLQKQKDSMHHMELGQDIGRAHDVIYVSIDNRHSWVPLHKFAYKSNPEYSADSYTFLERQLVLYKQLSYGRNKVAIEVITRTREYFTWEVAFLGLRSEVLPDRMRAAFSDLLIGLFLDVGDNYSIIEVTSNNFVYDEIAIDNYGQTEAEHVPHDFDSHFPTMRVWIYEFLSENKCLVASDPSRNILIKQVLRLVTYLIRYGFLGSAAELESIMTPVVNLINGQKDVPFPPDRGAEYSREQMDAVTTWRKRARYDPGPETEAIIEAKIQGIDLIELILIKEFNRQVRFFVSVFKDLHRLEYRSKRHRKTLGKLLYKSFDPTKLWKSSRLRQSISTFLKRMMEKTALFDSRLPEILFDLTKYKSDELIAKTLSILNKFFSSKANLFRATERTHVLTAVESVRVHRDALNSMVILIRLSKSKLDKDMTDEMTKILHNFEMLCHVPHKPHIPHPIGQNILVNNGLLTLLLPLVTREVDTKLKDQYDISKRVIGSCLGVLRFLAQRNEYVQAYLMENLEQLLVVQCCGAELALTLQEIFRGHTVHCLRLQPQHIQKMVRLAGQYREEAPHFLQLLRTIMKMDMSGTLLKRNQHLVTKFIMEHYKSAAYVMNMPPMERLLVIIGKKGPDHQDYFVNLIELLSTCAEGENRYIESLCQTLLPVDELLSILNNRHVPIRHKGAFARYLVWAYMRTARSAVESEVDELSHDSGMWKHIKIIWSMIVKINRNKQHLASRTAEIYLTVPLDTSTPLPWASQSSDHNPTDVITYMLEGGFLLLEAFFKQFYEADPELYHTEIAILKRLASVLITFADMAGRSAERRSQLQTMVTCIEVVIRRLNLSKTTIDTVFDQGQFNSSLLAMTENLETLPREHHNTAELELNEKMHYFGRHLGMFLEGRNTLGAQLGVNGKLASCPFVPDHLEVRFPLGEEFQTHVRCFGDLNCREIRAHKLIDQLEISVHKMKDRDSNVNDELDIRSLQILRAMIYNITVCLPEDREENVKKHQRLLDEVKYVQDTLIDYAVFRKTLPLLSRKNVAVGLEVLSLVDLLLFNANNKAQEMLLKYFKSTSEEVFFLFVSSRIQHAILAKKERNSIETQRRNRARAIESETGQRDKKKNEGGTEPKTKPREVFKFDRRVLKKKSLAPFIQRMRRNQLLVPVPEEVAPEEVEIGIVNHAFTREEEDEEEMPQARYHDGSDVVMAVRVMARLCDGQNKACQNYLREQPDNIRSVNLVAKMTLFIGMIYTHVDGNGIDLACQAFSTVNEFCQGLQENRAVVFNNKGIDYINFILRMSTFEDCQAQQVIELKTEMGTLLISLLEENDPAALQLAKEIRDTIDIKALLRHITMACDVITGKTCDLERLITGVEPIQTDNTKRRLFPRKVNIDKGLVEDITSFGFLYYRILARLFDIDKHLEKSLLTDPQDRRVVRFFRDQCMSVEVIKDDHIQKIHFQVTNKDIMRKELKEQMKWNIDRTSPSNKLRALISWSVDIIKDVEYQETVLKNPLLKQLAAKWAIWNYLCIFLSVVIQVLMLITWQAPMRYTDIPANATKIPAGMSSVIPHITWSGYTVTMLIIGACHNFCSLILFATYMLLQHPSLPDFSALDTKCGKMFEPSQEDDEEDAPPMEHTPSPSRLQPKLLSATTVYYLMMLALSFAGTFFYAYFFAFHLVNIIATNDLLQRVTKAVTVNGRSLLLVMTMGIIIIYLYGLVAFAILRPIFDPSGELYCSTLYQCVISVLRYGVLGNMADKFAQPDIDKSFYMFGIITIYQVTFFIMFTTIGLNIIFGIIVDTFSELRDRKWMTEKDMRDTCFICSRDSYDFEHEGSGFTQHVRKEHNMWAYVFYFLYLSRLKPTEYTSVDMHVANLLKREKLDFFPLNRALCLSPNDEDGQGTKLDDVMSTLRDMKLKQEEEDQQRRRDTERQRQSVWQEQYRSGVAADRGVAPQTDTDTIDSDSLRDESIA